MANVQDAADFQANDDFPIKLPQIFLRARCKVRFSLKLRGKLNKSCKKNLLNKLPHFTA